MGTTVVEQHSHFLSLLFDDFICAAVLKKRSILLKVHEEHHRPPAIASLHFPTPTEMLWLTWRCKCQPWSNLCHLAELYINTQCSSVDFVACRQGIVPGMNFYMPCFHPVSMPFEGTQCSECHAQHETPSKRPNLDHSGHKPIDINGVSSHSHSALGGTVESINHYYRHITHRIAMSGLQCING